MYVLVHQMAKSGVALGGYGLLLGGVRSWFQNSSFLTFNVLFTRAAVGVVLSVFSLYSFLGMGGAGGR